MGRSPATEDALEDFHPAVAEWFRSALGDPTEAQRQGWAAILDGLSTLLLAPTGSGKTLAAFLVAIDRLLFRRGEPYDPDAPGELVRVLYVSPLKALAVDVERNLRAPLAGIRALAEERAIPLGPLRVALRTGDTPQAERRRFQSHPPEVLITTPESLFLILTSRARAQLAKVETVIIDEIHAVASSKRGAHLALSLERLEELVPRPLQRIGLSATQRPLEEIARFLGGFEVDAEAAIAPRPVEIIDTGSERRLEISIEAPLEELAEVDPATAGDPSTAGDGGPDAGQALAGGRPSVWPAMHPRLVEIIRAHRSTMIFVNSRRLAERLASALNDEAEEELALAHHGSIAREQRLTIEDRLKRGDLPAIVATSSLELGIDMGAVDLVVQVEAPPTVSSGLQRIGRANHSVGEVPRGKIFPKYKADLLACAAVVAEMRRGRVEETRYPRSPLDVLAQQIVAMVALDSLDVEELYRLVRRAAPYAELPRSSFESLLDLLSGRYPSADFRELKPRLNWDRVAGLLHGRRGSQRLAVSNAGTIPDRGLYGVFLADDGGSAGRRVGELDEEMVFECQPGEVFLLGASSWRVADITHDRVLVTPAPGEPGRMPFWRGEGPGRSLELGRAIGQLGREIVALDVAAAVERLGRENALGEAAARSLWQYLRDQRDATTVLPSDETIVIESFLDEGGDWRVVVLAPLGRPVFAPWAAAVSARFREETGLEVETVWSDDGMVFRLPEAGESPDLSSLVPASADIEDLVVRTLSGTSLFAARFRENAARALLLPRRRPGGRNPLWIQRKRAADLLSVASRFDNFPLILETYRECLRDVFDLPGLVEVLRLVEQRRVRVVSVTSRTPSPFAAALQFSFVANFLYDGDAPLAEKRVRGLSIDPLRLRELLGEAELRELLDPEVIAEEERRLARLGEGYELRDSDDLHDLLNALGALPREELVRRLEAGLDLEALLDELVATRRVFRFRQGERELFAAVEDAARYRDALGVALPPGLPSVFLEPALGARRDLCLRYARSHGPFTEAELVRELGLGPGAVREVFSVLEDEGLVLRGAFRPEGEGEEFCEAEVLRRLKQRTLARLRAEIEPVEPQAFGRLLLDWQGIGRRRRGVDAVLEVIEELQGCPLLVSTLETGILRRRVEDYDPSYLDELTSTGEVVWRGVGPVGTSDGRIALYLAESLPLLAPTVEPAESEAAGELRTLFEARGASFFAELERSTDLFRGDLLEALWDLVWAGELSNDTIAPLRARLGQGSAEERRGRRTRRARGRERSGPPGSEGRWSLLRFEPAEATVRGAALARAFLARYGVVTREAAESEGVSGGFTALYQVLKAMEASGQVRRGYFVAGLGAAQFAAPGAEDRLRSLRDRPRDPEPVVVLEAGDPASPWGAIVPWPESPALRLERRGGARVVIQEGELLAYLTRGARDLATFFPEAEPARGQAVKAVARALAGLVEGGERRTLLLPSVDGRPTADSVLAEALRQEGFRPGSAGFQKSLQPTRSDRPSRQPGQR